MNKGARYAGRQKELKIQLLKVTVEENIKPNTSDKLNENGNANLFNCSLFKTIQLNYQKIAKFTTRS